MKKLIIKGADFSNCALENTMIEDSIALSFSSQRDLLTNDGERKAMGFYNVSNFIDISSFELIKIYTYSNGQAAVAAIYKNEISQGVTDAIIIKSTKNGFQSVIVDKNNINTWVSEGYKYLQVQCYGTENISSCYVKSYKE